MTTPKPMPEQVPDKLMRTIRGFQESRVMLTALEALHVIARELAPFLPATSGDLRTRLKAPPLEGQVNAKGYRVERNPDGSVKSLASTPDGIFSELSPGAAGALFSTLADLIQWLKVHVNQGRAGDFQLVSADNLKQMHLPQTVIPMNGIDEALMGNTIFNYGMGWFIEPYRGYTLIQHGGNVEGHSLIVGFVPQEKIGIVALTNIGMLPLRDVLLYESIDRALNLPEQDWNKKIHATFDPLIAGEAQGKLTAAAEKIENAPTTHPLEAFCGSYEADGYPDFAVRMSEAGMQACTTGSLDWSTLRHYHYNIFEWHWVDFDYWMKVSFLINENGEIASVSVPMEPEVENIVFTRKLPELSQEIMDALVGEYETPVAGMAFTISVNDGKVYAAQTSGTSEEIKPYRLDADWVGFRLKRIRFDFAREALRRIKMFGTPPTCQHLTVHSIK